MEHLRASHDEEMGEMIDVVNDLKVKEDELATVHRDLANQNNKIQELCKQLLSQEQSHKVRFFFAVCLPSSLYDRIVRKKKIVNSFFYSLVCNSLDFDLNKIVRVAVSVADLDPQIRIKEF